MTIINGFWIFVMEILFGFSTWYHPIPSEFCTFRHHQYFKIWWQFLWLILWVRWKRVCVLRFQLCLNMVLHHILKHTSDAIHLDWNNAMFYAIQKCVPLCLYKKRTIKNTELNWIFHKRFRNISIRLRSNTKTQNVFEVKEHAPLYRTFGLCFGFIPMFLGISNR